MTFFATLSGGIVHAIVADYRNKAEKKKKRRIKDELLYSTQTLESRPKILDCQQLTPN